MIAQEQIPSPLCGIPVAVKDIIQARGIPTSCGTASMRNHVPQEDAFERGGGGAVGQAGHSRIRDLHSSNVRLPINPWGYDFWAGGSSDGSGAATAAGLCYGSIGHGRIDPCAGCCLRRDRFEADIRAREPIWGVSAV
jgi:amidase